MLLAIDSTDRGGSIALADDGTLLNVRYENSERTHTARLMPVIESFLEDRGLDYGNLDRVAVATGPGSFTAIRLAVTTAKTLSLVCEADLIGLSSLRVQAEFAGQHDGVIRSVIDARRQELYVQDFEADGKLAPVNKQRIVAPDQFVGECAEMPSPRVIYRARGWDPDDHDWPPGTQLYPEFLSRPLAMPLANLAHNMFEAGTVHNRDSVSPNYIRKSDARRQSAGKETVT